MKLNFIFGLLFSVVALQMKGAGGTPEGLPPFVRFPGLEQEVYITRDTCKSVEGRFPGFSPFFVCHRERPVSKHSKKDTSYQCDGGILAS